MSSFDITSLPDSVLANIVEFVDSLTALDLQRCSHRFQDIVTHMLPRLERRDMSHREVKCVSERHEKIGFVEGLDMVTSTTRAVREIEKQFRSSFQESCRDHFQAAFFDAVNMYVS